MRKFAIEPDVIQVKQGEDVVLVVSTRDVQHGFEVDDMGINEPIQPGKSASIHLDTSKKGEFNVPVGDYTNPGIVQEENILACSRTLQGDVALEFKNYSAIEPAKGAFYGPE